MASTGLSVGFNIALGYTPIILTPSGLPVDSFSEQAIAPGIGDPFSRPILTISNNRFSDNFEASIDIA